MKVPRWFAERREDTDRRTASGADERRHEGDRRRWPRRRDERDQMPITHREFRRWRNIATAAFVALTLISCLAGYLGYNAGQDSQNGLKANATQATYDTCLSGGELRITIARGLDDLRSLALTAQVPSAVREEFIRRTQPAIDRLLTQAAYGTSVDEQNGRQYHAPQPPGAVTLTVIDQVRALSLARCKARAADTFGPGTVTN